MNYWLISDTHFNHTKLEEWGGRSGDWQQHIWNGIKEIPRGDTLLHLGDICIGADAQIHDSLFVTGPGAAIGLRNILIRGNHDKKGLSWYTEHGWDFVCEGIFLKFEGKGILFSHKPQPRGFDNFDYNIHGHTHGNMHRSEEYNDFYSKDYHIDISPELVGYKPVRLDTLLKLKKKTL